jgi:hypothetical protein
MRFRTIAFLSRFASAWTHCSTEHLPTNAGDSCPPESGIRCTSTTDCVLFSGTTCGPDPPRFPGAFCGYCTYGPADAGADENDASDAE